jgi:hypothetical protein
MAALRDSCSLLPRIERHCLKLGLLDFMMVSQAWKALLSVALLMNVAVADLCTGGEWDVIVVGKSEDEAENRASN